MNGRHVTAHFAGFYLAYVGATRPVSVDLIRHWCHRKKIRRVGTDDDGYALYDLADVMDYARTRGMLDSD